MLVSPKRIKVPDDCGDFCPQFGDAANMFSPCSRCPVFLCVRHPDDTEGVYTPVIEPEEYSEKYAQHYVDWWGESALPEIKEATQKIVKGFTIIQSMKREEEEKTHGI